MTKVIAYIRCTKNATKANIRFRLTDGNKLDITHTSEFNINPEHFDSKTQQYKSRSDISEQVKYEFNQKVLDRKKLLSDIYAESDPDENKDSKWFNRKVENYILTEKAVLKPITVKPIKTKLTPVQGLENKEQFIVESLGEFIENHRLSEVRKKNFRVIYRCIQRYELYKCYNQRFVPLSLNSITTDELRKMEHFFKHEYKLAIDYPKLYKKVPETRLPKPRGDNTISDMLTKLRTFFIWCIKNCKTVNNPFLNYQIKGCVYGTPIYITTAELKQLYETDLSARPALVAQRDIFVFQSLCGARISDFQRFTANNIINDSIEYIPNKAKHIRATTVVVPLNNISRQIVDKYKGGEKLLPFISEQKYNQSIKDIFKLAGLTRKVTVINTLTQEEEQVPLNTIASSHMCRRNMVANLYNLVQDTTIIGSMTGHSPNSRAFLRYRNVENEIKKNLMDKLNF